MKKFFSNIKSVFMIIGGLFLILLSACGVFSKKHLHGEELLKLSDDKLFETVYLQTLDLVDSFADEEAALAQFSPVQRTVYILSIYDMEIQNGGLCQFFCKFFPFLGAVCRAMPENGGSRSAQPIIC